VPPDTSAVRKGEELNVGALSDYLRDKIEGLEQGISIEQFPGGHSNLTYLIKPSSTTTPRSTATPGCESAPTREREYVLRRSPLGPVAPKAHDMAREFHVLQAINPYFPEAPKVYHLCEDPNIIGATFFIMQRRQGAILRTKIPPEVEAVPDHPKKISEAFIDCQIRLHAIDVKATGLIALGKPEGFIERQLKGWTDRWNRAKTEDLPQMDRVVEWLTKNLPPSPPPTLVHNDYKLDNVMLRNKTFDQIEAVLDWEMTTIGDPLSDLGLTLCYWAWATAPEFRAMGLQAPSSMPGWYSRDQFAQRYAEKTGRDLKHLGYHEVLGVFKLAVILQQIYYRYHVGQTKDERFRDFDARVRVLAQLAESIMEKQK
jgi:aminoglycoside phosphotransferase (APT) family kinase protein